MNADPICALATGAPTGAISVIRATGAGTLSRIAPLFTKAGKISESHTAHFGIWTDSSKNLIDEVLVLYFQTNNSYTGEESVEISCHASPFIVQRILESLASVGFRQAEAGEFTMRAFLNGKMDLSQAEAVADLIASQNEKAHQISLKQLRGGLSNELRELREQLIHFASMVELELDFAEEDVEFADRKSLLALVINVKDYVQRLIHSFQWGNAIKNGVPIAFVGRPNAGKSTVLNALLQEERAIVSDIPGTTRDTLEELFTYEGISFRLIDTAGIRESNDEIEKQGIQRSFDKIEQAALVVYLFDSTRMTEKEILADCESYLKEVKVLIVGTKKDQLSSDQLGYWQGNNYGEKLVYIKDKEDRDSLLRWMLEAAVGEGVAEDQTIVTNARHVEKLSKAYESLQQAENGLHQQVSGDFVAMDIRQAMYQIGQITGDISTDDLLGNIFSKFCIGK